MAKKQTFYQVGICPHCSSQTRLPFLFATNDYMEPPVFSGKIPRYMVVRTLSLFGCDGCKSVLLYGTKLEEAQILPKDEWVMDLSSHEFSSLCKLIYSTPELNYLQINLEQLGLHLSDLPSSVRERFYRESPIVDPATPASVKQCYEIGIAVRAISRDLYAVQLRKALEAICHDKGASEYLDGKRLNLHQQITQLEKLNVVGEHISKAALKLKEICNRGAHYSDPDLTDSDVRKLEALLQLITSFVYGSDNGEMIK